MEATTTKLYWNEGGRIGCADHTPYPGSDTWLWSEWRTITDAELRTYERAVGRAARCENLRRDRALAPESIAPRPAQVQHRGGARP